MSTMPVRQPPPMPGRTPRGLREAIARWTPQLLADFEADWKRTIAETYNLAAAPAFTTRWWETFAIERDPDLAAHLHTLEDRAAEESDSARARELLEDVSRIKYSVRALEPGE
ncbi:hypothetical protein [Streptacidiphilus albus]|jgi:hypothetical protein|uniref:hypothetical protein n=1 Tax=Streptacidiphilus albus TaxID=105425 RepID=UPI00054C4CED|nr:hypothetical protein [Streptacidiphilus albus]